MTDLSSFRALGLSENTLQALAEKGFEEPTKIQEKIIPILLQGAGDIIGQAQTGTGKTAAFGLPLIETLPEGKEGVQTLILAPTRELAIQVSEEFISLKGKKNLQAVPIYGGQSIEHQIRALRKGVDVVIGTPGRVLDLIKRKVLKLEKISHVVLDEADEMLTMGFQEELESILEQTPTEKQMLLFSATMPDKILRLAKRYMRDFQIVKVQKSEVTELLVDQMYYEVRHSDKFEALCRIIDVEPDFYGVVFTRTKKDADEVSHHLTERGYEAEALHGDIPQQQREKILGRFKQKKVSLLIATDVAARGIDVNDLTHVVNYSLPGDVESYVHRIGRTGRAGKKGVAITFVTPNEFRSLHIVERVTKGKIRRERLPNVAEVIAAKKKNLLSDLQEFLAHESPLEYQEIADIILEDHSPKHAVATLIRYAFQDELSRDSYTEINELSSGGRGGSFGTGTRLYIGMGGMDRVTPKKLVSIVSQKADVPPRKITEVKIFEKFSLFSAPHEEGNKILEAFEGEKRGNGPLVKIDSGPRGEKRGRGRGGFGGGEGRDRGGRGDRRQGGRRDDRRGRRR